MDPANIRAQFERIGRFRVLVIGRANAGKTTLLQRVCNTTDLPEVFDGEGNKVWNVILNPSQRGYHNIENELIFRSNPHFIFHDSCGFESGSVEELENMRTFLTSRSMTTKLKNRIHAIWYCIPANDYARLITVAEEKFFECDTRSVPVIALLTKADVLNGVAIGDLRETGLDMMAAIQCAGEREKQLLDELQRRMLEGLGACKFPPKCFLSLAIEMHEKRFDCTDLLTATINTLDEEAMQKLLISTQQANILLNIKWAVK
ncbi:hypothetical protein ID866_8116 [Astraeus odoratus]|nr:hypothetical protein ID866_8116 [Astraeus odoratus]